MATSRSTCRTNAIAWEDALYVFPPMPQLTSSEGANGYPQRLMAHMSLFSKDSHGTVLCRGWFARKVSLPNSLVDIIVVAARGV